MSDGSGESGETERRPATATPVTSQREFEELMKQFGSEAPVVIQFTAPWCRRCVTLKKEMAEVFDDSLRWLTVDIGDLADMQERFNVSQLPRFDVYLGGRTDSVEGFDAKVDAVQTMLAHAADDRPVLDLDADF